MGKTKARFLVILRKDDNSDWGAEVAGAPVFSVGSTPEEALQNLKEAIELHYQTEELSYTLPPNIDELTLEENAKLTMIEIELQK